MTEYSKEGATARPHGVLLDVGHGSAAVFVDGDQALVVDAGSGDLVTTTLEQHGVRDIAALVISHRHHDHTSELPALLANEELCVRRLFANADPTRKRASRFEKDLRGALNDSWKRNGTEYHQANVTLGHLMATPRLDVRVLAPGVDMAVTGVGARKATGGTVHPHALAVVVRVALPEARSVLLCADLDAPRVRSLIEDAETDLVADVLVYPHHGGLTGAGGEAAEEALALDLTRAVEPEIVVFSNGREKYAHPRREIVRGVRQARDKPLVRVVCTQLSQECSITEFPLGGHLDPELASAGALAGLSLDYRRGIRSLVPLRVWSCP